MVAIELQVNGFSNCNLLAMPVGIKQKSNVNATVQKVIHLCFYVIQYTIKRSSSPNFINFSFLQRILQLFYSITMAMWMGGGI